VASIEQFLVPLTDAHYGSETLLGGKAVNLARLAGAGFRVPRGFCITAEAYQRFLEEGDLQRTLHMELGRKALEALRWEEIWDAALRIHSAFLRTSLPSTVAHATTMAVAEMPAGKGLAVRSPAARN
jgi:pyruvate,water dikinase